MPVPTDDPMRYIPTKEEQAEAYDHEPSCHHPFVDHVRGPILHTVKEEPDAQ